MFPRGDLADIAWRNCRCEMDGVRLVVRYVEPTGIWIICMEEDREINRRMEFTLIRVFVYGLEVPSRCCNPGDEMYRRVSLVERLVDKLKQVECV